MCLKLSDDGHRFIYATSANEPLAELILEDHDGANRAAKNRNRAAEDRLITLELKPDAQYGIFDSLPQKFKSSSELADHLIEGITENYGHPFREFLQTLVEQRATNEKRLKRRITRYIRKFKHAVKVDNNNGSEARVAQAFGLVYAAGRLAKSYGVLPKNFKCMSSTKYCYQIYRTNTGRLSAQEELNNILERPGLYKLSNGKLPNVSDHEFRTSAVFLRKHKNKRDELMISEEALKMVSANSERLVKRALRAGLINSESGRTKNYRCVRREHRERVLCFYCNSSG